MKTRWSAALACLVAAPLLMGSGGFNPPPPGSRIVGPAVQAVIVLDPLSGQAAIRLERKKLSSGAVFTTFPEFFANFGCDPSLTPLRFENNTLVTYVPEEVVTQIFAGIGIAVNGSTVPVITDTDNSVCTPPPAAGTRPPFPGTLSFDAIIQFAVPGGK